MIRDVTLFTYTHSNCKDVWPLYAASLNEFFPELQHIIVTNEPVECIAGANFVIYADSEPYWEVICRALDLAKTNHILYMQEDYLLYDKADCSSLDRYANVLSRSDMSFVRLIRSGDVSDIRYLDDLYSISPSSKDHMTPCVYSLQPSIWKKSIFESIHRRVKSPVFGEGVAYRDAMKELNANGLYAYNGESKRGLNHYDSKAFPYMATALIKGKWNFSEYKNELTPVLNEFGIDPNLRGIF